MKQENSTNTLDVLTIWLGQLLILGLKADEHDLVLLRGVFSSRLHALLETDNVSAIQNAICQANEQLCNTMGQRYSWNKEGINLLALKTSSFFLAFESGQNYIAPLTNLRIVDAWSGLSSCLNGNVPTPLSLLDYIMDTILPVLSTEQVSDLCEEIDELFVEPLGEYDTTKLESILDNISKRICFNSSLEQSAMNEINLAVLMHLPKTNKDFSLKTGYLYKILQAKYAQEEK